MIFFCHHDSHGSVTNMNMSSFCRSTCLSTALPSDQQGRFGDYSQDGDFCKRGGQPSQSCLQDLGVQSYPEVIHRPEARDKS